MNKNAAIAVAIVVGIAAVVVPIMISLYLARQQSFNEQSATVGLIAEDVLQRGDRTSDQVTEAVEKLKAAGAANPCSAGNIDLMRGIAISSDQLQAVGFVANDRMLCSSLGDFGAGFPVGPPDYLSSAGFYMRLSVKVPFSPTKFVIATKATGYAAVVHPYLPIDVFVNRPDVSVGLVAYSSKKLMYHRGTFNPEWMQRLGDARELQLTSAQEIVALRRSNRYDYVAFAAIPLASADERLRHIAAYLVPIGVAAGMLLVLAIYYVVRQKLALPAVLQRRAAEEALRVAHAEQNAILESASLGIALLRDRRIERCNTRLAEMAGVAPGEMIGRTAESWYPDSASFLETSAAYEQLTHGETHRRELQMRRSDGKLFWCRLSGRALDAKDLSSGTVWMVENISEERAAADALHESEAYMRTMFDSSPAGLALSTAAGEFRYVSPSWTKILGYALEDLRAIKPVHLWQNPQDRAKCFEQLNREGVVRNLEAQLRRKSGEMMWGLLNFSHVDVRGEHLIANWTHDISELKAAEEALAEALERQRAIFSASPYGIAVFEERRFVVSSPSFDRLFGYGPGEVIGQSGRILLESGEDFDSIGSAAYSATGHGEAYTYETRMVRKDGSRFWCHVTAAPLAGGEANRRIVALHEDITARKSAEEALSAANAEMDAIFRSASLGILFTRNEGILRCNRRAEEMFGFGRDELAGLHSRALFGESEEEHKAFVTAAAEQLERTGTYRLEKQFQRREGSAFWCRIAGRYVNAADPAEGSVWMLEDITVEHEAAEVLRIANERLDLAQEASNVGVFDVDVVNGRSYWTPQLERMYGLEPGTFRGKAEHWGSLVHPEDHQRAQRAFSEALASDRPGLVDEFRVVRADGAVRWFQGICRIMRGPDGRAQRAVGVNIDVTELIAARRTAEEATQAKSMFLASMSHEIRTPMNGVMGLLQLLGFSKLDAEQKATVDGARDSARSLLRIIDDLLDFSKIEAGKLEIRAEAVSIAGIVDSVRQVYSGVASAKDLALATIVDPAISPALKADPLRLRQILNNFVSNAIKFTENGGVKIAAGLAARADGCDIVRFSVTDTGIGIPDEAQARLFQPFVQAEADTARRFGGTGLGLTICRRLAEMMGGSIAMLSAAGKGTTMTLTLTLPIADPRELPRAGPAGDDASTPVTSRRRAPGVEAARNEGTLVLVVEDHPTNRKLATRLLALLGYAAETAENGREGFEKSKSGRHGAIITDCNMPEMDGYELARAIRKRESRGGRRIPIIACTANALAGDAERCIEAGMDDFVAKPIELEALEQAMRRWLPLPAAGGRAAFRAEGGRTSSPAAAPPRYDAGAPIDRASLAVISAGDPAVEREILADFKSANDADMSALRNALAVRDVAAVTHASHRVKGACKTVGATALAGVCERMERAGRRNNWQDVAIEQAALEREFERLSAWLNVN